MSEIQIRDARLEDAERILEIYSYYVEKTAISFEYEVPTLSEFQNRMRNITKKYPYLVIEKDGIIQGYTYAGAFIGRAAYDWSCELTIYLDPNAKKCGYGRALYEAMEQRLKNMGVLNLYACIGVPEVEDEYLNNNSANFHAHLGFSKVGVFHNCGYKFDRWYHMIWMEKLIGDHHSNQEPSFTYYDSPSSFLSNQNFFLSYPIIFSSIKSDYNFFYPISIMLSSASSFF